MKNNIFPLNNEKVKPILSMYLDNIINEFDPLKPSTSAHMLLEDLKSVDAYDSAEIICKLWIQGFYSKERWREISEKRAILYADQLSPFIKGRRFLDFGCGNGLVGDIISKKLSIECISCDVINYRLNKNNTFILITNDIPFCEGIADSVLLSTVLHHADNPEKLLKDVILMASERIIIKESVYGVRNFKTIKKKTRLDFEFEQLSDMDQFYYTCFVDWFYNRILENGINVPFQFRTNSHWISILKTIGTLERVIHLGIDDKLGALYHIIYVVNRDR